MATPANPLVPIAPDVEEQRRQTSLRQAMLQEQARREAESRMTALTQEQAASEAQRRQMGQQHLAGLESQQAQLTQRPSLKQSLIQAGAIAAPAIIGGITDGAEEAGSALQGSAGELESERTYRRSLLDKLQQQAEVERGRQETEQFQGGELARRMEQQTLAERIRDMDLSQRMGMQGDLGYGRQEQQEYATQMRDKDTQDRISGSLSNAESLERLKQAGRVQLRKMPAPAGAVKENDRQADLKSQYGVVQNNINAMAQPDVLNSFDKPGVAAALYNAVAQTATHMGAYVPGVGALAVPSGTLDNFVTRGLITAAQAQKTVDAYNAAVEGAMQFLLISQGGRIGRGGAALLNPLYNLLPGPRTTNSKQALDQLNRFQDMFDIWKRQHPEYGGAAGPSYRDRPALPNQVREEQLVNKYAGR